MNVGRRPSHLFPAGLGFNVPDKAWREDPVGGVVVGRDLPPLLSRALYGRGWKCKPTVSSHEGQHKSNEHLVMVPQPQEGPQDH